jgi:hypothetical protein
MKKLYTTAFALLATGATTLSFGQSPRLVVVEHFTQASCGPCASQNPTLEATLNANSGDVIAVKNQVSWPGTDPMNLHYPAGPEDRRNFYSITGVPNTSMDGGAAGAPNTVVTTASIGARAAIPSPFTLDVSHVVSGGSIDVTVNVNCTQAVTGSDMRVMIAVVEREVIFASAPGSNGETEFHNVLKQYLPGTAGTNVAASWAVGDAQTVTESWTLSNVYDDNQLSVIAWVQDFSGNEIHQGGYSAPTATNNLSAMAFGIEGLPKEVCGNTVTPSVVIRNSGGTDLTSLTINYDVNGVPATPYQWTGNLAFLENATVALPAASFTPQANNTFNVSLSAPNGGVDDYPADDASSATFNEAVEGGSSVVVTIVPDNYGSETTWEIVDAIGTQIAAGGPYTDQQTTPEVTNVTMPITGCFEFNIFDSFGDGICCDWGTGNYTVVAGGVTVVSGGEFASEEERLFKILSVDVEETELVTMFNIFPNPTSDVTTLAVSLNQSADLAIEIYNAMGQLVYAADKGTTQAGNHNFTLDFNNLESGIYFVNVIAGDSKVSKRVTNIK